MRHKVIFDTQTAYGINKFEVPAVLAKYYKSAIAGYLNRKLLPSAFAREGIYEKIDAGHYHNATIDQSGNMICWGTDANNRCSDMPTGKTWSKVSCGAAHTAGIDTDGNGYCWGQDTFDQCSDMPTGKTWAIISCGNTHTAGIDTSGNGYCWGNDADNKCSDMPSGKTWSKMACGTYHTAGIDTSGNLYCWGSDYSNQCSGQPSGKTWASVSCGDSHTAGIDTSGNLYCWGDDTNDQCSDMPTGKTWASVSCGTYHTAGIDTSGNLYCWGSDYSDQCSGKPTGKTWNSVGCGLIHTIAIDTDNSIYCWGADDYNQCSDSPEDIPYLYFKAPYPSRTLEIGHGDSFAFDTEGVRYIRDYLNRANDWSSSYWMEIKALDSSDNNKAHNKTVTTDAINTGSRPLSNIVDNDLATFAGTSDQTKRYMQVDLGRALTIDEVFILHAWNPGRYYNDTKTQISTDGKNWTILYDSAVSGIYEETSSGKTYTISAQPTADINNVTVISWCPCSDFFYPKASPYSLSGLSLLRIKHNEEENLIAQNKVKTNEEYSLATLLKNKITNTNNLLAQHAIKYAQENSLLAQHFIKHTNHIGLMSQDVIKCSEQISLLAQNAIKEPVQHSLMVKHAIYEGMTAASCMVQNTIKTNDAHSITVQNTIKMNDTSSYATQLKNVKSFEKSFMAEHHIYEQNELVSLMAINRIKNYESTAVLSLNRIKGYYITYLTSLLEVIETFSKGKWKNMTAAQCDSFIPDYVHGMVSIGYNFANGLMNTIMENKGENLADLTYKQTQYSDTKDGFNGNTGYAKSGGIAMAFIPCRPGTYTLKLPDTYQLRDTDKILLYDCHSLPVTNFEATDEAWKISSEDFNGRELSITTTGNWLGFGIYSNEVTYYEVNFTDFQLVSGTTVGEKKGGYGWRELPELHGIDGEYSDLQTKKVECETGVSGTGSVTSNGEVFVAINESTGEITWGDLSGGKSLSLTAGTYTVIYVLSEAVTQESKNILVARLLSGLDNNFFVSECKLDTFAGDGTTTAFTLTATADNTNYEIFVAGIKQSSGISKTTTGFTFTTAPKRGAIVEAKYNLNFNMAWFAEVNVYEPSGTEVTISGIPELSISANKEFYEREDRLGDKERKEKTQDYTITLNADLLEDAQSFYNIWKDKKFRMIVENTNGSVYKKDIVSVCSIEGCTKNYLGAIQSITIKATNYYEGVTI